MILKLSYVLQVSTSKLNSRTIDLEPLIPKDVSVLADVSSQLLLSAGAQLFSSMLG